MSNNKPIPVLYENKADCCGCSACYAICPKSAIEMKDPGNAIKPDVR